jgi:uncharacterized FlaG/YvyC family protein
MNKACRKKEKLSSEFRLCKRIKIQNKVLKRVNMQVHFYVEKMLSNNTITITEVE